MFSIPKCRWFPPTPASLLIALLAVECFLLVSQGFRWFPKGWAVLIAVAGVVVVVLLMLLWFVAAVLLGWRFQCSIRWLPVLLLAVAIPCGWLAIEVRSARNQQEAVKAIERLEATIYYDYQFDASDRVMRDATPPEPRWLRELLGDRFFSDVWYVGFLSPNSEVTDDSLDDVAQLVSLRKLQLFESSVTDAGLIRLRCLPQLEDLLFRGERITDDGLQHLVGMEKLKNLWLDDTQVGDNGMLNVSRLPSLIFLSLSGTKVGDKGLARLQNARHLAWLNLPETPITDAGMEYLRSFEGLHYVNLAGTHITDKGFLLLKGLSNLEVIKLRDTLPGRGKQFRENMRQLSTDVTQQAVQDMQKALPNCKIIH
jgi:hypothetical protein